MKKSFFAFAAVILALILSFTACGKKETEEMKSDADSMISEAEKDVTDMLGGDSGTTGNGDNEPQTTLKNTSSNLGDAIDDLTDGTTASQNNTTAADNTENN